MRGDEERGEERDPKERRRRQLHGEVCVHEEEEGVQEQREHTTQTSGSAGWVNKEAIMANVEQQCTILVGLDHAHNVAADDIISNLEKPEVPTKIAAMKQAIVMLLSGEPMPRLLMAVIKGCLKEDSKELKKLVMTPQSTAHG